VSLLKLDIAVLFLLVVILRWIFTILFLGSDVKLMNMALCPNCHRRADRGEIDRKSLGLYKANLRFVHDKYSNFEIDMLFELYQAPQNSFIHFLLI